MDIKLFDSELKVMDVIWREGDTPAKEIARQLTNELGWNVNTTYTLIKRCMKKGAIERSEPGFLCHALIPKSAVQEAETDELINKVYDGSADKLFAALLGRKKLSAEQIERLRQIVALLHRARQGAVPPGQLANGGYHVARLRGGRHGCGVLGIGVPHADIQQHFGLFGTAGRALGRGAAAAGAAGLAVLYPEHLFTAGAEDSLERGRRARSGNSGPFAGAGCRRPAADRRCTGADNLRMEHCMDCRGGSLRSLFRGGLLEMLPGVPHVFSSGQ